ncbi:protein-L-isoaspartate(D-aspartate) O-methyltransferase [Haloglomus halophilum]|uniref:protein-L-isoaspartate(D-aspartate) O-methyltransferase n=1 Tax=Haloglomus halophilum TaxID=2962672 RepID=UPI002575E969|nr:protein-L-isoaspartate(D-aspartate) O-methyltransferase [Haloglomus halophilum]
MADADYREARERMVEGLVSGGRISDDAVAEALRAVPRHEFVPEGKRDAAYADRPLPIGDGQTISAPHMVAVMAELLDVGAGDRVLEIGTGCGYHAAVTAELGAEVYSVEFEPRLAREARERLDRLGYDIHVREGDGHEGWPEHAPYDAAYLTCAADAFPEAVVEQVRPGGRLLAPLSDGVGQTLVAATRREDGSLDRESHGGVRFVEMRGG